MSAFLVCECLVLERADGSSGSELRPSAIRPFAGKNRRSWNPAHFAAKQTVECSEEVMGDVLG